MYLGTIDNTPGYRKYLWIFFLAAIGFCAFIFDYALSRVTIKIYPQNVRHTTKVAAAIDQKASSAQMEKMLFPAKVVEKDVSLEAEYPATGVKKEDGFASGQIVIESKREKDISLPKGYKLVYGEKPVEGQPWRDKIIFMLDHDILIPAGGSITAAVTAINKGERGNVAAGPMYFASMATWNRERLLPKTEKNFAGGVKETKIVAAQDLELAKDELIKKIKKNGVKEYSGQLASDKSCREDLSYVYVSEFATSKPVGEAADNFQSKMRGRFKSILLPHQEIREALEKKIVQEYSKDDLVDIDKDSLAIKVTGIDIENGKADLEVSISGTFAPKFSSEIFEKRDLAGFNETAIKQKYSGNPAVEKVEVKFFPFWRKTVPSLEDHVFIEIVK